MMRAVGKYGLVLLLGMLIGVALVAGSPPVGAQAGTGVPSLANGDVNADGGIDISDAVHLLNWLFSGGPEPAIVECSEPPPVSGRARFRLVTDLRCNQDAITSMLEACGSEVTDRTDEFGTFTPSQCMEVDAREGCQVRLSANTACGPLEFCRTFDTKDGELYDVYLYFDLALSQPRVIYFRRTVVVEGQCPSFPDPTSPFTGSFGTACGGGGGTAVEAGWSGNG